MKAVTAVFRSASDAERCLAQFRKLALPEDRFTCLTPAMPGHPTDAAPTVPTEQSGVGKALGAVIGGAAGLGGGSLLVAALVPGVGVITAVGILGEALLGVAGAAIGAVAAGKSDNSLTKGLPEDEIFVYEDALSKGCSVVIAMAKDEHEAVHFRELLETEGAESIDAAREKWWIGLRSAEKEHYSGHSRNFSNDERFYRLGFEAALHARTRCKEYDQILAEMDSKIRDIEREYPGMNAGEPFREGFERGREYYQQMCKESKAA